MVAAISLIFRWENGIWLLGMGDNESLAQMGFALSGVIQY